MPSVGTRRTTRVFVPKSKPSLRSDPLSQSPTAHIRSVKQNNINRQEADVADSDWLSLFNDWAKDRNTGAVADGLDPATAAEAPSGTAMEEKDEKTPDIVYTRKRARLNAQSSGSNGQSKRYGTVYIRKRKNKRPKIEAGDQREGFGLRISDKKAVSSVHVYPTIVPRSSWDLARRVGVSENDITTRFKVTSVVLGVLVEMKCNRSSRIFLGFLLSVFRWIRSSSRAKIWRLISFLLKGPIARVFSVHGVHFLPLLEGRDDVVAGDSLSSIGVCKMHESSTTIPFLSLNFSSLPSYFTSLHLTISLRSLYIPIFLVRPSSHSSKDASISNVTVGDHANTCISKETTNVIGSCASSSKVSETPTGICASSSEVTETPVSTSASSSKASEFPVDTSASSSKVSETPSSRDKPLSYSTQALYPLPEFSTILHSSKLRGHQQRKRSSSRITRSAKSLAEKSLQAKQSATSIISSYRPKPLELPPDDSSQSGIDSDVSTPLGKHRRSSSVKSPVDRVHERQALAEAKQNIESVQCKANILVTLEDRCYREDDAILSMEESESSEWLICVTLQDNSKFRHKPNEMRPCVVNRFTHAYMWTVDEVMRLEFVEKLDWLLFKELHAECRVRNSREKEKEKEKEVGPVQIPIPGVSLVPGYNMGRVSNRFVLPDTYIRVLDDEVQRAMKKEGAIYEADSDDERWLYDFNGRGSRRVTLEEFEMVLSLLEKDAYNNPVGVGKIEGVFERCKELKRDDAVVGIYEYWLKRRNSKENAMVRFFQWEEKPVKVVQWAQKPYLKKKRSFKRQRSQVVARLKSEQTPHHDPAEDESVRRAQEAEAAAKRTVESAIRLRTRAQTLMEQAELATYRAIMAVRISDALNRMPDSALDSQSDQDVMPFP
ncbi:hypothetical protein LUZ63_001553 [Rhynchospora breviuscula]|uniref:Enhancer of polycomb-like protein n=1 Tax=Rhynchospora breviuscula TaxID=2022672 RepID=A0A9Q0HX12_9POAL|nr:hypothetical protein LUZ63_001553 [Rhynchospora breviuscula]